MVRVVIVGGGFAGLTAARTLQDAPVDITLIDRTNHYLFQPLLYQVAAGVLSPADIALPIRFLLRKQRNASVLLGDVDAIDLSARTIVACGGAQRISYDYLIVATGARHSYFGHPEWESAAPGLKTLDDAREVRRRFLLAFEQAERSGDPAEQSALLTFVIVGGGPTGVELAGILPTIAHRGFAQDFRRIDPRRVRVLLLEGGPRVLPTFPEDLAARAARDLADLGVTVRTNAVVTRVTPASVHIGDEVIATRTVFWAAGNAASPLIKTMGIAIDRAGRALVAPDLSVPGHPNVFVVGDAAGVPNVPGLAAAANQMGAHAGRMIARTLAGQPTEPFSYHDRGSLAVIGRGRAIAKFPRLKVTGLLGFFIWLFVHILYLAGFRNRLSVALEWGYAFLTHRPGARLLTPDDVISDR